jgi:hypothetical protein
VVADIVLAQAPAGVSPEEAACLITFAEDNADLLLSDSATAREVLGVTLRAACPEVASASSG